MTRSDADIAIAAWFDGAIAATRAGDLKQAQRWLNRLIEEHPDHALVDDALFMQLRNAFDQENSASAEELANEFLKNQPESPFRNQVNELLGQLAYQNERYAETVQRFTQLLDTKPESSDAHQKQRLNWSYYAALGQIGLEQFGQAETILQSLASTPDLDTKNELTSLVQIALATTRFSQGKFDLSIENYENHLSTTGWTEETANAQHELILCYAQTGRWKEAKSAFIRSEQTITSQDGDHLKLIVALALDSPETSEPEFWYAALEEAGVATDGMQASSLAELAWLKRDQQDDAAADRLFDELLERFPMHPAAAQAGIARAKRFETAENFSQAAAVYEQVARNFADQPTGSVARLRQSYALHKLGTPDSLRKAKSIIERWLEQADVSIDTQEQPEVIAEALYQAAWINEDLNDTAQRDECFQELVGRYPESKYWPDAAYRVVRQRVDQGSFERAIQLAKLVQQHDQTPARILARTNFLRGKVNAKLERWSEAEALFDELTQTTDDPSLRNRSSYWLAESQYRQNKFALAGKRFAQLQQEKIDELASLRPWILLRSAQCQAKQERWQDSAATAKLAISEFPNFSLRYEQQFFVARGQEDAGLLNDAINGYQQVIDSPAGGSAETSAIAQWRIGEIRFHQEDYSAAIEAYYRVDSIFGYPRWRAAALLQAGKCQEHLENWKHAEKLYRQLLTLFPDSELASDAQDRLSRLQSVAAKETTQSLSKKQR